MSDTFHILKGTERHVIKKSRCFQIKYPLFLSDFNVTLTLSTFIEQYSNNNHHDILSGESSPVPRIQMDGLLVRHDKPNSRISQFRECT